MSHYDNNLEEGFNNDNNFYYLSENNQSVNQESHLTEFNDSIYAETNFFEHLDNQPEVTVNAPTQTQTQTQPSSSVKSSKKMQSYRWLYIFFIFVLIALVGYLLVDQKIITLPSMDLPTKYSDFSISSTSSPFNPVRNQSLSFLSLN
jgi:hypothetical protein